MNKLRLLLLIIALANTTTALGSSFYQEAPAKVKKILSKPIIVNYKGKLVAEKNRHVLRTISLDCPQGTLQFTTIEWPHKGQISAMWKFYGKVFNIRGTLNKDTNGFEGQLNVGEYEIIHLKGVVKENSVEGSVWVEFYNMPFYNSNGLCIANFKATPSN